VTKSSYRVLHTLTNLGPAPEPNLTVLWSKNLPHSFKRYCVKVSRETSSLQYENDDLMRPLWGDDYGIACCVSAMRLGKQMQFFGARVNLAKALLYAINGGRDEISGEQIAPPSPAIAGDVLDYNDVDRKFDHLMEWLARTYVHAMNCIHYMHDKYFYERLEFALHDRDILRTMGFGIAGLSVVADSLAAIKYGKVHVIRDGTGLAVDYRIESDGPLPHFGNNDDRVDSISTEVVSRFMRKVRKHQTYRNATHTQAFSRSLRTSFMASTLAIRRTAAARANHSPLVPIPCMVATVTAGWLPVFRSPNFRTGTRWTASATPSLSPRKRLIYQRSS
jgi:formate C-acetyltransferase